MDESDDAVIRGQLCQIFPQVDVAIIQRTIEEAKAIEGNAVADILTQCIELVLDRQAARRIANAINSQQENDDVVIVVKSVKKDSRMKNIPVVYVGEDRSYESDPIFFQPGPLHTPPPFSDIDSDSEAIDSEAIDSEIETSSSGHLGSSPIQIQSSPIRAGSGPIYTGSSTPRTIKSNFNTPQQASTVSKQQPTTAPSRITTSTESTSLLGFVKQMFPKVNTEFVQNLSQQGHDLNAIVNTLLERPDMQRSGPSEPSCIQELTQTKNIDYYKECSKPLSNCYYEECLSLLKNEFRRVSVQNIRNAMRLCNSRYAPTRKLIEEALLAMSQSRSCQTPQPNTTSPSSTQKFTISRLIASKRTEVCFCVLDDELKREIEFVKAQGILEEEKKNAIYAAHLNEQQYQDEGQLIECGCCFGEFPFEDIVQCSEGHLFCKECLHGYAKEIIFGSSMTCVKLTCMGEDCSKPFPYNQLKKCLTNNEIEKYQSRLQEDCLAKAEIPDLHQCPFCDFAAIVPEQEKVFACLNPTCGKESCKECKEPWKDHFGLKCNEIEKKSETNVRVSYEEKMTMAKVRKCAKCSLTFTKLDGCNKMTCRCGSTQCYVCRKPYINYNHFCRHPRDPGKKCAKCTACSLWTDPTEDDELAIKQLQEEAVVAKRKLNEEIELPAKKLKV